MSKHRGSRRAVTATSATVLRAAAAFSKHMTERGFRHALVGGLAVRAHGYDRATSDADFLVSGDAQDEIAGASLGGEVSGKTIVFRGIDVDLLFPRPEQDFLENDISRAVGEIPIIPIDALIYMKLVAGRARDQGDVVELLKRGRLPLKDIAMYLRVSDRPDLVEEFESLQAVALAEGD